MSTRILLEDGSYLLTESGDYLLLERTQLTIAGVDFLPQYKTNSARIRELVQNKSGVMNFEVTVKSGQSVPQEGSEIVFKDQSRFLFGGYITRITPVEIGKGSMFVYTVEASDYGFILNNKIAKRAYANQTLGAIVADLMNTYMDASYGFDLTNVLTGPTLTSIVFDHISLRKCFEKLSKLTGYVWYVDYQKKLYFTTQTTTPAPETITDAGSNCQQVTVAYDTTQVRNRVIVIGSSVGEAANAPTTQSFTGDTISRIFALDDIPASVAYIKLNGVSQNFHVATEQVASDYAVYYADAVQIRLADSAATPGGGDTIEVQYYPYIAVIAERQDDDSIAFFAALDGGDGVWDYTIKDQSITTKQEAADRAAKELAEFADPIVKGIFVTRTSLLSPGSVFSVGQVLTVNLATYGISTDTTFLIQEVNIEMIEDSETDRIEYIYTVRFGGRLTGVQEFLEGLASESDEVADATEIKTIELLTDSAQTADLNLSHANFTPPFKYGNSGTPRGRWNLSEWA
jgi:hypothetical protein